MKYEYNIVNKKRAMVIATGTINMPMVALGSFNNSNLIAWPNNNLLPKMKNRILNDDKLILQNLIDYLTKGPCTNYSLCYHPIEDFQKFTGVSSLVFGISANSIFDLESLQNQIFSKC